VHSYPDKWSAENAAKSVAGVRAVANDIEVKLKADAQRTDREIAEAAVSALKSQVTVPANDIKLISSWREREDAASAAWAAPGVAHVKNLLSVHV
jgi:osmotically-inducible protein OsmY